MSLIFFMSTGSVVISLVAFLILVICILSFFLCQPCYSFVKCIGLVRELVLCFIDFSLFFCFQFLQYLCFVISLLLLAFSLFCSFSRFLMGNLKIVDLKLFLFSSYAFIATDFFLGTALRMSQILIYFLFYSVWCII